jgi:hypothetical protein
MNKKTLQKYGLTEEDFNEILDRQGGVCPICKKAPSTGRWVIDHEHIKGYKKMPSQKRKQYVRGITCWFCNRYFLAKGLTKDKAKNVVTYLDEYNQRKLLNNQS